VANSKKADAADVARVGFRALMEDRDSVVAGSFLNKIETNIAKVVPQKVAAKMHEGMSQPNAPTNR
jgi:hypothetical protein